MNQRRLRPWIAISLAVAVSIGAGCSADVETDTFGLVSTDATQGTYTLDRETGAILFPADRYTLTDEEEAELASAGSVVLEDCARLEGVEFMAWEPRYAPEYQASAQYGVWTTVLAERFGFVSPMSDADLRANGVTGNRSVETDGSGPGDHEPDWGLVNPSPEAHAILADCRESADFRAINSAQFYRGGAWSRPLGDAIESAHASEGYQAAFEDLEDCYRADGLEPDGMFVAGVDASTISAEQISLALRVVACKDDVNFVERAVVEVARRQIPIIDRYEAELTAQRESIDEALARAEEILAKS